MIPWFALLIIIAASTLTSLSLPTSLFGSGGRNLGVIAWFVFAGSFFVGALLGEDRRAKQRVMTVAVAASILVSSYALLQAIGFDIFEWHEALDLSRSRSTLGSATFLGAYLVLILPLGLRLALDPSRSMRVRAMLAVATTLAAASLLTTQTRGAWVGGAVALVVMGFLERARIFANPRKFAFVFGISGGILLALIALTPIGTRLASITELGQGTARGRLIQWDLTLDMVADRPLLGWGPDTYLLAFPRYISEEFERVAGRTAIPDRAHNVFLDIATTLGIFGLVAFGWVVVEVFRHTKRLVVDPLVVAPIAAFAGYLAQMFFAFPLADLDVLFWLFAGMSVKPLLAKKRALAQWGWVAAALTLALGVWATRDVVADVRLRNALEAEADGRIADAKKQFDVAVAMAPERIQYAQSAARFKGRAGQQTGDMQLFEDGLEDIERAERFSFGDLELMTDRADLLLSWGETAGDRDLIVRAEEHYRRVLRRDRNSSRVLLKLGVAVAELDRLDEAERIWLQADNLAPMAVGPALNLARLYEDSGRSDLAIRYYRKVLTLEPDLDVARAAIARLQK